MSLSRSGINGITGGCSFPTNMRYVLWLRLGSIRASNSINTLRNFEGIFSQVCVNRETALLDKPITMAKNAFKFWNSLQLKERGTR